MRRQAILRLSLISPCRYKAQGSLTSQPVALMSAWSTIPFWALPAAQVRPLRGGELPLRWGIRHCSPSRSRLHSDRDQGDRGSLVPFVSGISGCNGGSLASLAGACLCQWQGGNMGGDMTHYGDSRTNT